MNIQWIEEDVINGVKIKWQNCIECGDMVFTGASKEKALCGGDKCGRNKCIKCGYEGDALDWHHIRGRKNSTEVVRLCCNCHAEEHRGSE
jgi:hypothetical protein